MAVTEELVEAQAPEQRADIPAWEFRPRQNPKWGTVTREGLVVGRGDRQRVIPPDEVYRLSALGCSLAEIAVWFGVSESTMRYNFAEYWARGQENIKQRLRAAQIKAALNGNATLLIWLGKNMLNQTDQPATNSADQILPWTAATLTDEDEPDQDLNL